jgi:hypothetical protein
MLTSRAPGRYPGGAREEIDSGQRLALLFEGGRQAVSAQLEAARGLLGGTEDARIWDEIATRQAASRGRVSFGHLESFLADTAEAVVRVGSLTAYVPDAVRSTPSPLVERIRAELAG